MGKIEFQDKTIACKLCGAEFTWKAGEQEFYFDKELSSPTKCPECRAYLKRKFNRQERVGEVQNG